MGDVGEYWADVRPGMADESKKRRARNREGSAEMLTKASIPYEIKNDGAHLVINLDVGRFDFWPGTGLWRQTKPCVKRGRGVRSLIMRIKQ